MNNQEHWNLEQYKEYQKNRGKRSKYGAKRRRVSAAPFSKIYVGTKNAGARCTRPLLKLGGGKKRQDALLRKETGSTALSS